MPVIGKVNKNTQPKVSEANGRELSNFQCKICDETESIDITFGGDQTDKVTQNCMYKISNAQIRTFQGNDCLSLNSE